MNIEKAEAYFKDIYEKHYPEKYIRPDGTFYWSQCRGDHGVSGWEFDIDMDEDDLCYEYKIAADILGLPIVPLEKSPPQKPKPESEKTFMDKAWDRMVVQALESFIHTQALSSMKVTDRPSIIFQKEAKE